MGAYLSEPMINKESEDGNGNELRYGASSMQGWRASQEDAHTCMAQFDEKASLFGVYDGHGGAEVAIYVAKHFPDLLKSIESYSASDMENALIQAYLKMDESIKEPEVLAEIQKIAKLQNGEGDSEAVADYEDENVSELYEEATMPLDKLVAKYQKQGSSEGKETDSGEEKPGCSSKAIASSSSSSSASAGPGPSCTSSPSKIGTKTETEQAIDTIAEEMKDPAESESAVEQPKPEEREQAAAGGSGSGTSPTSNANIGDSSGSNSGVSNENESESTSKPNHCTSSVSENTSAPSASAEIAEAKSNGNGTSSAERENGVSHSPCNGLDSSESKVVIADADSSDGKAPEPSELETSTTTPTKPRKGKVHPPTPVFVSQSDIKKQPARASAQRAIKAFADSDSDLDSSDSDLGKPAAYPGGNFDSDSNSSDTGSGEDEEDSDDDDDDSDDEADDNFLNDMQEPGYDSGCTAVVSLLKWKDGKLNLWVANAGDSRCVVSRGGQALEMSYDHKPEAEVELLRIVRAGGKVTDDGRVNGGLNLSRALGDHSYKQNATLPLQDQMISPLPAIQHVELDPEKDDFIVLACDGVWNSMSSQQVVDFVGQRIKSAPTLSSICEELFDACLSEDTCGDGTGCDNMTAIVVQLPKPSSGNGVKRPLTEENELEEDVSKRPKLEGQ